MPTQEALTAVAAHMDDGRTKHPKWGSLQVGLGVILDRYTKLAAAIGSDNDPNQADMIGERALQLAGLSTRLVEDFGLPVIFPDPKPDTALIDPETGRPPIPMPGQVPPGSGGTT